MSMNTQGQQFNTGLFTEGRTGLRAKNFGRYVGKVWIHRKKKKILLSIQVAQNTDTPSHSTVTQLLVDEQIKVWLINSFHV
jgi:hypothetical protein